jgi:hypothetical protein
MKRFLAVLLILFGPSLAWAEIELNKEVFERDTDPVVAKVTITNVPDGAKLRGSFSVSGQATVLERAGEYLVWAGPGEHAITSQGVWVLTQELDVNGTKVPVLVDFGTYLYTKKFVVKGGDGPVPPPPPPPPGERRAVILEESDSRTATQAALYSAARKQLQGKWDVLDQHQAEAQKFLKLVEGRPLPILLVLAAPADSLVRAVAVPTSVDGILAEMSK